MSAPRTFDIADPAQLRDLLQAMMAQLATLQDAVIDSQTALGTLAAAFEKLPDHQPLVKADLVERFRAAASAHSSNAFLQMLAAAVAGELTGGSSAPPPQPPRAPLLRLVVPTES